MGNVKTAISIQDSLFKEIDALANKMHISRSYLVAMAARDFIRREQNRQILQQLNTVYSNVPDLKERKYLKNVRARHRRLLEGEW